MLSGEKSLAGSHKSRHGLCRPCMYVGVQCGNIQALKHIFNLVARGMNPFGVCTVVERRPVVVAGGGEGA